MREEKDKLQNSLMVPEKENIITRFVKWVKGLFGKNEKISYLEEPVATENASITIPKAVKMPTKIEESIEPDENSLEYLYQLSDQELDDLDDLYNKQMEEAKEEIIRLDNILQTYKQSIKKLQGQVAEEES